MKLAGSRLLAALATALGVLGCASEDVPVNRGTPGSTRDAASETLPPEDRRISLTTYPFWNLPVGPNGFGQAEALEGVNVCVAGTRPYGSGASSFMDAGTPCAPPSRRGEKIVLKGVQATAEVMMTAALERYRPNLYAVTTWQWNQDPTGAPDVYQMSLMRPLDFTALIPAADPLLGSITISLAMCGPGLACRFLEGATVSLEPPAQADSGPYYTRGGKLIPDARTTASGEVIFAEPDLTRYASAHFVNLRGPEFSVRIAHPYASCDAWGSVGSFFGFADSLGVIRVPVLPGHSTVVLATCTCEENDATTCAPITPEAGAD